MTVEKTAARAPEGTGEPLTRRHMIAGAALVGAAPITKRSGKAWHVHMRYACKRRLRAAVYHWARTSLQHDAPARAYYDRLRQRGHTHGRALRSVSDSVSVRDFGW